MAVYTFKEAKPAPSTSKGVVFWLRENLFSNISNSLLTLVGMYIIYVTIPPLLDWMIFDATWSGTQEEVVNDGARWIFIIEKFNQFIYGFYPVAEYWRPNLVALLSIAFLLAMNLIPNLKVKIGLILVYPIICFVLISGGFGLEVVPTEKWAV